MATFQAVKKNMQIKQFCEMFFSLKFDVKLLKTLVVYMTKGLQACWFWKFLSIDEGFENEEAHGRKSVVDKDQLKELVKADLRKTVWQFSSELGVSVITIFNHRQEIKKSKKFYKWH